MEKQKVVLASPESIIGKDFEKWKLAINEAVNNITVKDRTFVDINDQRAYNYFKTKICKQKTNLKNCAQLSLF